MTRLKKGKIFRNLVLLFVAMYMLTIFTSASTNIMPIPAIPSQLDVNLSGKGQSINGTIFLSWNYPQSDVTFNVYRNKDSDFIPSKRHLIARNIEDMNFTDQVHKDGEYYYKIAAINTWGKIGQASLPIRISVNVEPPKAPIVNAISGYHGKIILEWEAPKKAVSYEILKYNILSYSPLTYYTYKMGSTTDTSYEVQYNDHMREYTFQVIAIDALGRKSAPSKVVTGICDLVGPEAPELSVDATLASEGKVILSWTTPADSDLVSYEIYR
ncbi:MAG: hypothetical protein HWN67_19520, partial [Candidatus Helarchaeota archaeon]|nr:hypothetical protein [Candidatus Helarchaeota archaeon]